MRHNVAPQPDIAPITQSAPGTNKEKFTELNMYAGLMDNNPRIAVGMWYE